MADAAAVDRARRNPLAADRGDLRSWSALERDATGCTRCALAESRTQVVFGSGNPEADLLIVGDAPSRHDDLLGEPLGGGVGNVLSNAMTDVGIDPGDAYVTTIVKCHPPSSRAPAQAEIEACLPYLYEQIAHVRPTVIVALGAMPTQVLLGRAVPFERLVGFRLDVFDGVTLVPTMHPVEALRGHPQAVPTLQRDLRVAKGVLDGRLGSGADAMAELRARHERGEV